MCGVGNRSIGGEKNPVLGKEKLGGKNAAGKKKISFSGACKNVKFSLLMFAFILL